MATVAAHMKIRFGAKLKLQNGPKFCMLKITKLIHLRAKKIATEQKCALNFYILIYKSDFTTSRAFKGQLARCRECHQKLFPFFEEVSVKPRPKT